MADAHDIEVLWNDFHRVVNMPSPELADWLRMHDAGENVEPLPDQAGGEIGRHVLAILQKRRRDLTDGDIEVMQHVVDEILSQVDLENEPEPESGHDTLRRHHLMSLGHDPLRAPRTT
ncbi:DUF3140 domain-containing protein [Streptomyces poonensis]|uniref:DUF3140 domain-containing protein n=1 Tax=Streptomyces poonensis TaxID=68255 RepID=A0A918QC83_9ACTN|nr:DUF3140 domain-containing protein [Streptomyces poonensis]GGZ41180.1 hypothetical protein GCM10010365_72330 [Streptomyces poonensis]GLJ91764.1 hypothetical protein GCM10017589_43710 [Streptomyces poonensis]